MSEINLLKDVIDKQDEYIRLLEKHNKELKETINLQFKTIKKWAL